MDEQVFVVDVANTCIRRTTMEKLKPNIIRKMQTEFRYPMKMM